MSFVADDFIFRNNWWEGDLPEDLTVIFVASKKTLFSKKGSSQFLSCHISRKNSAFDDGVLVLCVVQNVDFRNERSHSGLSFVADNFIFRNNWWERDFPEELTVIFLASTKNWIFTSLVLSNF